MMGYMHEREKDAAKIDVAAAQINANAAELAELADERSRSADAVEKIGRFTRGELSDDQRARRDSLLREKEIAAEMSTEIQTIRAASARLQELAAELRQPEIVAAAASA